MPEASATRMPFFQRTYIHRHDDVFAIKAQRCGFAALQIHHQAIQQGDVDAIPFAQPLGSNVDADGDDFQVTLRIDHLDTYCFDSTAFS